MTAIPNITLDLAWQGGMRFSGQAGSAALTLDGPGTDAPTPVQALAFSLAACMGIDLVQILTKGRFTLTELHGRLEGERRVEEPKYFTRVSLHFSIQGDPTPEAVDRAIALSREKYCSVWHSLRQDIDLRITYELTKAPART
jgi:putative redox protein